MQSANTLTKLPGLRLMKPINILACRNYSVQTPLKSRKILVASPNVSIFPCGLQSRYISLSSLRFETMETGNIQQVVNPASEAAKEILDSIVVDVTKDIPADSASDNTTTDEVAKSNEICIAQSETAPASSDTVCETVSSTSAGVVTPCETSTTGGESSHINELVFDIPEKPTPLGITEMVGEPSFESLGLASWWPSGRMQYFMEMLHVSVDLEWWQVIMATTVCVRLVVFPIVVMAQRNMANFNNNSPAMVKLQDEYTNARQRGDTMDAARTGQEIQAFMKKKGLNPLKNMGPMFLQMPIFMSMFFGLRGMANLPVASMKTGGLAWFTNLTLTDPFYLLPILTSCSLYLQFKMGAEGAKLDNMTGKMKMFMTAMPFMMLPITINFPCAVNFYWLCTNMFSIMQAKFLRIPAVRSKLNIPEMITPPKVEGPKKSFKQGFHDTVDNFRLQSKIVDRRKYDEQMFKDAGVKKQGKYFKHDPTKPVAIKVGKKY